MAQITAFSARNIATRERLEDYAADGLITTAGGLELQIAMVCDGAGGGEVGELAARLTSRTILGYIEVSTETNVPKLLVRAVEEANRLVYGELRGVGTSTLAMVAVDLNDHPPYGRMYMACVGDSRVYLIRKGQMVRLNIDHTLANEYIYAGQMSVEEAGHLENADYPTRVIGISPDVQVDIGFYAERGKNFVPSRRAFHIGEHGMLLREGDTLIVSSDGLFGINSEDNKPYLHEEELMRHALDDDVVRAGQSLIRYATTRRPADNVALSMLFVPSRERRAVRVGQRLTARQRFGIGAAFAAVVTLMIIFGIQFIGTSGSASASEATVQAFGATLTEIAVVQAYTPTPTNTPTATPTNTPTPTPTLRPTIAAAGQVGNEFFPADSGLPSQPLVERQGVSSPQDLPSYLSVEGAANILQGRSIDTADIFMLPETTSELDTVDDTPNLERIDMLLYPRGDLFMQPGQFAVGGVDIALQQDVRVRLTSNASCLSAKQIPRDPNVDGDTDKVAFTCYTGMEGDCSYEFSRGNATPMPIGQRVVLDIQKRQPVGEPGPILFSEVKAYYDAITLLVGENQATCLFPYLDEDGDGIRYPLDHCETAAGPESTSGCPDSDGDGLPDFVDNGVNAPVDRCPNEAGPADNNGCPLPTATPLPDTDHDGLNDLIDKCPLVPGPRSNNGCPIGTNP